MVSSGYDEEGAPQKSQQLVCMNKFCITTTLGAMQNVWGISQTSTVRWEAISNQQL